jgi:hypothetical protein
MTAPFEPYRVILDYEALQDGFLDRIEDLNTTFEQIEAAGGIPRGHASRMLMKSDKRVVKAMGPASLAQMLKGTGLVLALVEDDERFAAVKAEHLKPRTRPQVRTIVRTVRPRWLFNSARGSKTRAKAWENVSPEMRKKMMRKVAKARWRKRRKSAAPITVRATESGSIGSVWDASAPAVAAVLALDCAE